LSPGAWPLLVVPALLALLVRLADRLPGRLRVEQARDECTGSLRAVSCAIAFVAAHVACSGGTPSTGPPPNTQPPPASPVVALSPASLTFSAQTVQTTSAPQTIALTNGSSVAATVSSITASGDFAQTNNCAPSVAAGTSCAITVTFTPTAAGQRAGILAVTDNAANSPQTVSLTGIGASAAAGTPAGTYQIGITGSSGTLTQGGAVTLLVQ